MDRFIAIYYFVDKIEFLTFKIQYGQIYRSQVQQRLKKSNYLKSNMDRFIDGDGFAIAKSDIDLKSNMDRFIVLSCC